MNITLGRSNPATIGFAVLVMIFITFDLFAARALPGQGRTSGVLA